jgi:hypothetical protein
MVADEKIALTSLSLVPVFATKTTVRGDLQVSTPHTIRRQTTT